MRDENKEVTYSGEDMLAVLQEIEYMLISLHKMGSYFSDKDRTAYETETTAFVDNSLLCDRLAGIRRFLSESFDSTLGDDDMDDMERACEGLPIWRKPGDYTEKRWLK